MEIKVERSTPCLVSFSATVGEDEVAAEREQVVATFVRGARLPGFRKGKAPRAMVERRYGDEIRDELQDRLLHEVWRRAGEEGEFRPASDRIQIDGTWQGDGGYEVRGEVEVYPVVEIADPDEYTPPEFDLEPSEEEVEKAMTGLRERQGAWEPVAEGTPVDDDLLVEAEVHGSFPDGGGEPFHEERSLFRVGAGEVFPEIEGAVRGATVGDEVTAERTLGEDAGEQAGTRVSYRVTIKSLRRRQLPELDDEFARSLGVEEGLVALRERIKAQVKLEKAHLRRDVWRAALVRHLAGDSELALPESLVEAETRKELVSFAQSLAARGVDPEQAAIDWNQVQQDARGTVTERLRGELLLDAAADRLGIEISEEELDAELQRQAGRMGVPFAELKGNLAKGAGLARVRAMLRRERGVDQLLSRLDPRPAEGAAPAADEGKA